MKMDKNRFETQKEMVYLDYTNRHDSPQLYFTVDDLKWLIEQTEKLEKELSVFNIQGMKEKIARYEKALKFYANKENYEEWNEDLGLTEYIHSVDFDGGDTARKSLEE
jgi:hypothetical protein